ncbi:MAG TPA: acyl carrier protein [Streptosporangiaceae bacterium]|nr:acyl carrier protein [Streptosporangiaceae bacterium]
MEDTMTDEAICRLIGTVVGRAAGKSGVTAGMSLRSDLGLDSIGLMSVVFMLEEQTGIDAFSHVQEFVGAEYVSDIITIVRQA